MAQPKQILVPDSVVDAIRDQFETSASGADQSGSVEPMVRQPRIERRASDSHSHAPHELPDAMEEAEQLKKKLTSDWRLVKRARFNAAKRLRNRHEAGQFAFAISGIYGFLVPLFLLQFDSYLSNFAAMVISFVAAVAGALSFTIAMQYQQKDFKGRSAQMHECGRKINNLSRHLLATPIGRTEDLRPFIHHYDDILARCENHDEIDFALARLSDNPKKLNAKDLIAWKRERWILKFRLYRQTYTICAIVWLLPLVIGCIIWWALSPK